MCKTGANKGINPLVQVKNALLIHMRLEFTGAAEFTVFLHFIHLAATSRA
jgi:hypothetical protein